MNNETIANILREMRSRPFNWSYPEGIPQMHRDNEEVRAFADRIEKAVKREMDDAAKAIAELAEGICAHCDMQIDCAEGEDGMPTKCNAMCGVRKFIDEHKMEEKSNEFPF